ncbi:hypothetical protein ICL81_03290 [Leucobacter sp. cx-328]|uniref:hypothetical protein n=1 Tax=unclassified Leucobacter TaxID=2621730 RepID=UPI00165E9298|nr:MULTISPECIES: hypothetical protein [unclassified Leucobacter]MBC9943551.1 hypothetical protein [Leucobacter sp. cx-328]
MTSEYRPLEILAFLVTSCLLLTGCSGTASAGKQNSAEEVDYSHVPDLPDFKGPWADEFREAYASASNEEIRDYLRDEVITEAEKQAVTEAFRSCVTSRGLKFDDFENGLSYTLEYASVTDPEENQRIASECEKSTGAFEVISLYYMIQANPDNHDRSAEITACLIRSGVVPADYTVEKFRETWVSEYAIADEFETAMAEKDCEKDPEGAFRD